MGEQEQGGSNSHCDRCGDAFDVREWYPAEFVEGDAGNVRLLEFCSADCRDAWHETTFETSAASSSVRNGMN